MNFYQQYCIEFADNVDIRMGTWNETNGSRSFGAKPLCQDVLKIELVTNYNKISVPKKRTRGEGNTKYAAMIFLFLQNGKPLDKNETQNDQDINRYFTKLKPSQEFYICWNISANPRDKLVKRWRYHKKFTFVETSRRIQTTNWSKDGAQGCD